ncbi:galactose oxidase [Aspergillus taichungensis]|uniref:Galactose oxidase n=1 Tax=Aspergillus taichungensis TaxID=482145 RepID=A0A2J5I893_9EURO|nr:galactose oxidase [Aspergillus taichungensis]
MHKEKQYQEGKTAGVDLVGGVEVANLDQPGPPGHVISSHDVQKITCFQGFRSQDCAAILDGSMTTDWSTSRAGSSRIIVQFGGPRTLTGLVVVPSPNKPNNFVTRHSVFVGPSERGPWKEVAYGTWWPDTSEKQSIFQPERTRYLRIELNDGPIAVAELKLFEANEIPPNPRKGAWGPTIDFPLVPTSGAVDPLTGEVLVWSSWGYKQFTGYRSGKTQTARWNPDRKTVTQRKVDETDHDMFCSGISSDVDGNVLVFGGNDAIKISLYNTTTHEWQRRSGMASLRGYESSTMCSDGRIFSIGGSFSGETGGSSKDGEIYDPKTDSSKMLPGAQVDDMLTADRRQYRMDNHAWLFGWKDGYVFQAGPSDQMNWYGTRASGSTTFAGMRGDQDAMCGNAVMYDEGKILGFGGSRYYETQPAIASTYILTLTEPKAPVHVDQAPSMKYTRTFHTSVVLPDGSVFTHGGQDVGLPFNESGTHFTPERFVPDTSSVQGGRWEELLPNNVPRVYHSIAMLLQDGTVFTGGGGLCGDCAANHFDAQIYTPPYLLNDDGSKKTNRPVINSVSPAGGPPGTTITIQTDRPVNSKASIIRYGSATHTVDTDQRRVGVRLSRQSSGTNTYSFEIPEEPGVATPGYYMLFVLDNSGVPSVSKNVQVMV